MLVVESLEMQNAVDDHVRPMRLERFFLRASLARNHGGADYQFSQLKAAIGRISRARK